jgi:MOSC domain-containing protein YiiM
MERRKQVTLLQGHGILGDRYAHGKGKFSFSTPVVSHDLTLFTEDAVVMAERYAREHGLVPFEAIETRRNILVGGISAYDLNRLVHQHFYLAYGRVYGVELAAPCGRPSKLADKPGFKEAFAGFGGIRARVITSTLLQVGDELVVYR